jgi:hypothetical protein
MTSSVPNADPIATGVVLLMPFLEDTRGCDSDMQKLTALADAGTSLETIWATACNLLDDPVFRKRARNIEFALWSHPVLTGEEVSLLAAMEGS